MEKYENVYEIHNEMKSIIKVYKVPVWRRFWFRHLTKNSCHLFSLIKILPLLIQFQNNPDYFQNLEGNIEKFSVAVSRNMYSVKNTHPEGTVKTESLSLSIRVRLDNPDKCESSIFTTLPLQASPSTLSSFNMHTLSILIHLCGWFPSIC